MNILSVVNAKQAPASLPNYEECGRKPHHAPTRGTAQENNRRRRKIVSNNAVRFDANACELCQLSRELAPPLSVQPITYGRSAVGELRRATLLYPL